MRDFLIILLVLLWLILGWLFRQDQKRCCESAEVVSTVTTKTKDVGPLLFSYNDDKPLLGPGWPSYRDSIVQFASDSTSLEISGWYCTNLTPPESEEIGLRRASKIRMMFMDIPDDHIIVSTQAMDCDTNRMTLNDISASFTKKIRSSNIKETEDKTLIYFPFNSTQKLNNAEIENYLNDIAARVLKSGEQILVTGHTDNVGSDESNVALGQRRAEIVKNYLIQKGVTANKIRSSSQGEKSPIADNNIEEGRAKNRRTELQIIK
jgi:OOP family OmpA-OmpF porin